jgi:hypothetical protein
LVESDLPYERWFADRAREIWLLDRLGCAAKTFALFEWEAS